MLLTTTLDEKAVDKSSAETLGPVTGAAIDAANRSIAALKVGKGRKAQFVAWKSLRTGADAVVVEHRDALHEPSDEIETRFADGDVAVIGGLVLSDRGNAHGKVVDVEYDEDTGVITAIHTSLPVVIEGTRLRAIGTYAWIVAAGDDEATPAL
jgi:sporulation protein YlmC with PRC-barrel domain